MEYNFTYRKNFFWQTKKIEGHKLHPEADRMDLFFKDGTLLSLSQWSKYDLKLGTDWVVAVKKQMEKESGQEVSITK